MRNDGEYEDGSKNRKGSWTAAKQTKVDITPVIQGAKYDELCILATHDDRFNASEIR